MRNVIEVKDLKKNYGTIQAVKGITFSVEEGSLFAFLGSNGAGKSTTIEILCTLLEASSGEVLINGHQLGSIKANNAIRQSIGIVFQDSILDDQLSVKENILHRGRFYGLNKKTLVENYAFVNTYLNLSDIENKYYGKLSGGQKRRADIARAIIHKPKLLFLDEPTTGLDPHTRKFVWEAIEKLRKETNMTIFLTTHYMEEAAVADKIIVLKEGQIVASGTPNELKERFASDQLIVAFKKDVDISALPFNFVRHGDVCKLRIASTLEALSVLAAIEPSITSFEVIKGSLDHVFIQINEEMQVQ